MKDNDVGKKLNKELKRPRYKPTTRSVDGVVLFELMS